MDYKEIYKYEQYKRCSRVITKDVESQAGGWSKRALNGYTTLPLRTLISDRRVQKLQASGSRPVGLGCQKTIQRIRKMRPSGMHMQALVYR